MKGTRPRPAWSLLLALSVLSVACRMGRNYPDVGVPRFSVDVPVRGVGDSLERTMPDSIRLVTFNVRYAQRIDEAITVLTTDNDLRDADIVLLQEMDGQGTARIASALKMGYVYYPATYRLRSQKDFGNAILSRWPILADERIVLPHRSHVSFTERAATAASIRVGHRLVRVYSAHLGTLFEIGRGERRNQFERVMADAMTYPYVIIGGDMNSSGVGPLARQHGYTWLTARNARTTVLGRWDHFFTRGFDVDRDPPTGVSGLSRIASDHRAVWTVLPMRGPVKR